MPSIPTLSIPIFPSKVEGEEIALFRDERSQKSKQPKSNAMNYATKYIPANPQTNKAHALSDDPEYWIITLNVIFDAMLDGNDTQL